MITQLRIIGLILVVLALIHVVFPRRFKWKDELSGLSLVNKQLMYVHTFFVALVVFLIGALCLYAAEDLVSTRLGRVVCIGLFIFWFTRLVFQFFVYSRELWKGKRFETGVHTVLSFLWAYLSTVFFIAGVL